MHEECWHLITSPLFEEKNLVFPTSASLSREEFLFPVVLSAPKGK
jgi:hypothetical protein